MQYLPIEIHGASLRVRRAGKGEPILFLHGVPGDCETLAPVADLLSRSHCAVTASLRYAGPGPHGTRKFGTQQQFEDLLDLIPALGAGQLHLVAWSFSAHAALALTRARPDLVLSCFVYEPGFPTFVDDSQVRDEIYADMAAAFGPVFSALERGDLQGAVQHAIDGAAGQPGWFRAQPEQTRRIHLRNGPMLGLLANQTAPIPISRTDLNAIRVPVTVAWGKGSRPCYRLTAREAAEQIPGARRREIPAANHLYPEADPAGLAAEVRAHLEWAQPSGPHRPRP